MNFLSCFSGIECASAALAPVGWKCVGVAEIDPFACAVLKHRYPDVPNLGDVTADDFLERAAALRPDVLVGGPPCQDFSIAGLRAGLEGDRGNLSLRWAQIIHAVRPLITITENVPGWFSVNEGRAFGSFLAAVVGHDSSLIPPENCGGRWTDSGMVAGPEGRAAWRILDAQYFKLAQRRRRVFVVSSFGDGFDPAAILFEPEGVRRNHPPSRQARERVAPTIAARTSGGGGLGTDFDCDGGLIANALQAADGRRKTRRDSDNLVSAPLNARPGGRPGTVPDDVESLIVLKPTTGNGDDVFPTLDANHDRKWGSDQWVNNGFGILEPISMSSGQSNAEIGTGVAPTLTLLHEAPIVAQAFKPSHYTRGKDGRPSDIAPSLSADADKGDQDTLVMFNARQQPIIYGDKSGPLDTDGHSMAIAFSAKDSGQDAAEDLAPTLRAMHETDGNANGGGQVAIAFESRIARNGRGQPSDIVPALKAQAGESGKGDAAPLVAIPFDTTQITSVANGSNPKEGDPCHTMSKGGDAPAIAFSITPSNSNKDYNARPTDRAQAVTTNGGAPSARGGDVVVTAWQVRRLTPTECERLMGLADGYTNVPYRKKPAADGPRYKSLGNGIARDVLEWIGWRVDAHIRHLEGKNS